MNVAQVFEDDKKYNQAADLSQSRLRVLLYYSFPHPDKWLNMIIFSKGRPDLPIIPLNFSVRKFMGGHD